MDNQQNHLILPAAFRKKLKTLSGSFWAETVCDINLWAIAMVTVQPVGA